MESYGRSNVAKSVFSTSITILPWQPEEEKAFDIEEEQPNLLGNPFVAPFQLSNEMPLSTVSKQPSEQSSVEPVPVKRAAYKPRFAFTPMSKDQILPDLRFGRNDEIG